MNLVPYGIVRAHGSKQITTITVSGILCASFETKFKVRFEEFLGKKSLIIEAQEAITGDTIDEFHLADVDPLFCNNYPRGFYIIDTSTHVQIGVPNKIIRIKNRGFSSLSPKAAERRPPFDIGKLRDFSAAKH